MINYTVERSRRRTMAIQVDAFGKVKVKAPLNISQQRIEQFILQKQKWIASTLDRVNGDLLAFQDLFELRAVMLNGNRYPIQYKTGRNTAFKNGTLFLPEQNAQPALARWLKKQAGLYLPKRCRELAELLRLEFSNISVKGFRSKWGSCNSRKEISFNFRLRMENQYCIDYVIIHELLHLVELNHSKRFWNLMAQVMPDYKLYRAELKKYNILSRFP